MADGYCTRRCYSLFGKSSAQRGQIEIRILVALEDHYRAYREVIAVGIRILRPHAEVEIASPERLGERIERFEPDMVICGGHEAVEPEGKPAWVELSLDPRQPSKIWFDGRYSERTDPTLEVLVAVIDEAEELLQANAYGSIFGTQQHAEMNYVSDFRTVEAELDRAEEEIERRGGRDAEELKKLIAEVRALYESGEPLDRGRFAKYLSVIQRNGWIAGPIAGTLLSIVTDA
jgi:hypothetical protein